MLGVFHQVYKCVRNRARYKKVFPQASISSQTSITGVCTIGEGVQLNGQSTIESSTIGSCSVVSSGSALNGCCLGRNTHLVGSSSLARVDIKDYVTINQSCLIFDSQIESYSYIAQESLVGHASLGRFCSVGPRTIIGGGTHPTHLLSTSPVFYSSVEHCGISFSEQNSVEKQTPIQIGHDVWIGAHAYLRNGIVVGSGAIIGAGAVVTKDVPPYAIVGGVPARIIRYRFDESEIQKLLGIEWWNWTEDELRQAQPIFLKGGVEELASQSSVLLAHRHNSRPNAV